MVNSRRLLSYPKKDGCTETLLQEKAFLKASCCICLLLKEVARGAAPIWPPLHVTANAKIRLCILFSQTAVTYMKTYVNSKLSLVPVSERK